MQKTTSVFAVFSFLVLALAGFSVRQVLIHGEDTPLLPIPDNELPAPGFDENGIWQLPDPIEEPGIFDGNILQIIQRLNFKCKDLVCRHISYEEFIKLRERLDALLKEKTDLLRSIEIEPSYTDENGTIHNFSSEDFASSIIAERDFHFLKIQDLENIIDLQDDSLTFLGDEINSLQEAIGSIKEILNSLNPKNPALESFYNDQISRLEDILSTKENQRQNLADSINSLYEDIRRRRDRIIEIDSLINMIIPKKDKDKAKLAAINQSMSAVNLLIKTCVTPTCTATDKECGVLGV